MPTSSDHHQAFDKMIENKLIREGRQKDVNYIYNETGGEIDYKSKVFKTSEFMEKFGNHLRLVEKTSNSNRAKEISNRVNRGLHHALQHNGAMIGDQPYKYLTPQ